MNRIKLFSSPLCRTVPFLYTTMMAQKRLTRTFLLIGSLVGIALISGYSTPAALIRPSPYLTRAEAAAIILLSRQQPLPAAPSPHPYTDIVPGDWFANTMLAAAELRMLSPDPTGTQLKPFGPVNRATFLKMVTLAFDLPLHQPHAFSDVPSIAWYAPYVGTEATYHLLTHEDPRLLEPDRLLTHEDIRTAMKTFLALYAQEQPTIADTASDNRSISTKRLRVVLVSEAVPLPQITTAPPSVPYIFHAAPALPSARSSRGGMAFLYTKTQPSTQDAARIEVVALINSARKDAGVPPLMRNEALEQSAQRYAEQMAQEGFFGHEDAAGTTLQDRIAATAYNRSSFSEACRCITGMTLGENLARGLHSPQETVDAWMASPSHRNTILDPGFTDTGIGVFEGIWVQHFGGVLEPGA